MKKDNLTVVLGKFAGELNIRIDLQKVYDELLIHPDYPSLLAISDVLQNFVVTQALYHWYEQKQKNYDAWAKAYPVELNEAEYNKINRQKAWCEMAEVTATPTMLLNGYRLPSLYQLTDLKYMLQ